MSGPVLLLYAIRSKRLARKRDIKLLRDGFHRWPDLLDSITTRSLFQPLHVGRPGGRQARSFGGLPCLDVELLEAARDSQLQDAGGSGALDHQAVGHTLGQEDEAARTGQELLLTGSEPDLSLDHIHWLLFPAVGLERRRETRR